MLAAPVKPMTSKSDDPRPEAPKLDRPKWVAVVTGILAIAISVGYLILVQLIDYRGSFEPAPIGGVGLGLTGLGLGSVLTGGILCLG